MSSTANTASAAGTDGVPARNRLSHLARLIGPTTLFTALLYFYGYVSLKAYYSYFGISLSALDLSTTDYLVRTPDALFRPIAVFVLVLVVCYVGHYVLLQRLQSGDSTRARRLAFSGIALAVLLAAVGVLGLYESPRGYWSPLALAAAALLVEYTLWVLTKFGGVSDSLRTFLESGADLRRGLVIALVVVGAFWAVNEIAQDRGADNARLTEASLPLQPQAVVYSAKDLQLPVPDANVEAIAGQNAAYAFRANGLRPLLYANGRWFLLPVGWRHDNGVSVIVLEDKPMEVRVDLAPGSARLGG